MSGPEAPRAFRSQVLTDSEALSLEEARRAGRYVLAHYEGGRPVRLEKHAPAGLAGVVWLDPAQDDDALLATHRGAYPGVPCEVVRSGETDEGVPTRTRVAYAPDGGLRGATVEQLRGDGEPAWQVRTDAAGGVLEETQYVYSEDGALRRVLERAPGEDWQVVYDDE